MPNQKNKIMVVGLRGFPNIQGGVETHCEELYPRLAACGYDITVIRRKGFVLENPPLENYKGVHFMDVSSPSVSGFEAAVHSLKGVWIAKREKADILHIHAIGPSVVLPFAKLLGLKVVMTHHGLDYNREKWSFFPKMILKAGEFFAAKGSDDIISISTVISDTLKQKYNRSKRVHLIHNGITTFKTDQKPNEILKRLNLTAGKYILGVGRLVQEKRFDKLIEAYAKLNLPDYKLIIAGDSDYTSSYACYLKEFAEENQVIMPGRLNREELYELYKNAGLFVLPSSHEGLPISLLEAMSCECKVLASDIPANLAVELPEINYFRLNDLQDLMDKMHSLLMQPNTHQSYPVEKYNWDFIARQTSEVYQHLLNS